MLRHKLICAWGMEEGPSPARPWGIGRGIDAHGLCLFQRWLLPGLSLPARAGLRVVLLPLQGQSCLCWRDAAWCPLTPFLCSPCVAGPS